MSIEEGGPGELMLELLLDRDKGWLTDTDKEFLLGEMEFDDAAHKRVQRERLRTRVENGLIDLSILYRGMLREDRELVFGYEDDGGVSLFDRGLKDGFKFLYEGMKERDMDVEVVLESLIVEAEEEYHRWRDSWISVDVDISRDNRVEDIYTNLTQSGVVGTEELFVLAKALEEDEYDFSSVDVVRVEPEPHLRELTDHHIRQKLVNPRLESLGFDIEEIEIEFVERE